jgi:hypothetical protein
MYSGKTQEDSEDESDEDDGEADIDSILDTLKNVDIKENGTEEEDITGMPRKIY